jgi:hypothetical protein
LFGERSCEPIPRNFIAAVHEPQLEVLACPLLLSAQGTLLSHRHASIKERSEGTVEQRCMHYTLIKINHAIILLLSSCLTDALPSAPSPCNGEGWGKNAPGEYYKDRSVVKNGPGDRYKQDG